MKKRYLVKPFNRVVSFPLKLKIGGIIKENNLKKGGKQVELNPKKLQQEFLRKLWGECLGANKLKHTVEIGQPYLTLLEAKVHEISVEGDDERISKIVFKFEIDGTIHEIIRPFKISVSNIGTFQYFAKDILKTEDSKLYYAFVKATSNYERELISRC